MCWGQASLHSRLVSALGRHQQLDLCGKASPVYIASTNKARKSYTVRSCLSGVRRIHNTQARDMPTYAHTHLKVTLAI